MRNVLVTGASGFVGQNLTNEIGYTGPNSGEYDLNVWHETMQMFRDNAPDCVVHLAAKCGGIGYNQKNEMIIQNLGIGLNVLNASYAWDCKLISLATVCAYPKFAPTPFNEDDIWNGYPEETYAPYGIAKKTIALAAEELKRVYGFNAVNLFPANLYGPHDHFEDDKSHVIPALIKKFLHAKDNGESLVEVWGDGTPTREFLFVKDLCRVIRWFVDNDAPKNCGFINVGNGIETSIAELVEIIIKATGYNGTVKWQPEKPNGQPRRCLNIKKLERIMGNENVPKTKLRDGIHDTIEWYKQTRKR